MASESENLDGAAANLQESAKEALQKTETSGSKASEFIQNIAHIVTDKSNQAADSSKTYIANVVHNVESYAQQAASGAGEGGSNMKDTLSKAIHVGAYPGSSTGTPGEGEAASVYMHLCTLQVSGPYVVTIQLDTSCLQFALKSTKFPSKICCTDPTPDNTFAILT